MLKLRDIPVKSAFTPSDDGRFNSFLFRYFVKVCDSDVSDVSTVVMEIGHWGLIDMASDLEVEPITFIWTLYNSNNSMLAASSDMLDVFKGIRNPIDIEE